MQWPKVNIFQIFNYHVLRWQAFKKMNGLTNAPSRLKIADAPTMLAGAIFLRQRLRRNVSEERSFLWNFQPIRDEYSHPSPKSFFCRGTCRQIVLKSVIKQSTDNNCNEMPLPLQVVCLRSSYEVEPVFFCDGCGTFSPQQPKIWVYHQEV